MAENSDVGEIGILVVENEKFLPEPWRKVFPQSEFTLNPRKDPFWMETPLQKGLENGDMPIGLSNPITLANWNLDFNSGLELNGRLLEIFERLTEVVDPLAAKRTLSKIGNMTDKNQLVNYANDLINGIWTNIYGYSPEKPRTIKMPGVQEVISEIGDNPERAIACWFSLKAYFAGGMMIFSSSLNDVGGESQETLQNNAIDTLFLWSYGMQFLHDSSAEKSRFDLAISDLTDEGKQQLALYKGFYQKLFSNPFLKPFVTANREADARKTGVEGAASEKAHEIRDKPNESEEDGQRKLKIIKRVEDS